MPPFTITDTSEKAVAKDVAIDDPEFDGKKIPSPADDLDGFKKMVGKKAVYEPNYRTLQYYVTKSYTNRPVKGQTEEYLYEHMIDLSAAGAIEVAQGKTLVQVNGGHAERAGRPSYPDRGRARHCHGRRHADR